MATYTKLKSGEWGIKVQGTAKVGEVVTVTKKDGSKRQETIAKVVWTGNGISLCAVGTGVPYEDGRPTKTTRKAARKAPLSSGSFQSRSLRDPVAGEQMIHRDSRGGEYTTGETIHATRIPGGGGPDGRYWTVVASGKHKVSQFEDDCREGEMSYDAIVRPATDAEAQPVVDRIAAKEAKATLAKAAVAILTTGEGLGRAEPTITGYKMLAIEPGRPGSLASTSYVVTDDAGTCYHVRPVYDDSPVYTRLAAPRSEVEAAIKDAGWSVK